MAKEPSLSYYVPYGFGNNSAESMLGGTSFGSTMAGLTPPSITPGRPNVSSDVFYDSTQKKYYVSGYGEFEADDAQRALESSQYIGTNPVNTPPAGNWQAMDTNSFLQYVERVKNPGMGELAAKNFGIGVDNLQLLLGYGTMLAGDVTGMEGVEQFGQGVVSQQLEDIRKNEPYQRQFTDIGSDPNRGVLDWFVANLAQQGPNMLESLVTVAVGAGVGAASGGGANPLTAAGGALMSLTGKTAFKQSLLAAAKKYAQGEALDKAEQKLLLEAAGIDAAARQALARKVVTSQTDDFVVDAAGVVRPTNIGGRTINNAEAVFRNDILPRLDATAKVAQEAGKRQAQVGGAALLSGFSNYATGVADVYGETVEAGDPNAAAALIAGVPYALLETIPEYLAAARFFGDLGPATKKFAELPTLRAKAVELLKRGAVGGVVGAGTEGFTEAAQEALLLAANPAVDWDSPEGVSRLINSFAAGAGVGGPIGGLTNLKDRKAPVDLLKPMATPLPPMQPRIGGPTPGSTLGLPGPDMPDVQGIQFTNPQLPYNPGGAAADPATSTISNPVPLAPPPAFVSPSLARSSDELYTESLDGYPRGEQGYFNFGNQVQYPPRQPVMTPSVIQVPPQAPAPVQFALQPQKTEAELDAAWSSNQPAGQPIAPPVTTGAPVNAMTETLARLRRNMVADQADAQRMQIPTPAERDYNAAMADMPTTFDIEGASGKNEILNSGKRRIIAGVNMLSKAQQDAILNEFDNNLAAFYDYIRNAKNLAPVRKAFARLANVDQDVFDKLKAPPAATPQAPAQPIATTPKPAPTAPVSGVEAARAAGLAIEDIPYTTANGKKTGVSPIIDMMGRKTLVVNINGVRMPFYLSSGLGGKASVQSGKWYPFFGMGREDGWINKGSEAEINNYYGSPELKAIAQQLDATIGDIRTDKSYPIVSDDGKHDAFINRDMNPADNKKEDTRTKLDANIKNVLARIRGEQTTAAPAPAPAANPILAKEAAREAKRQQKEAEREAKRQQKEAERQQKEAERAAKKAERDILLAEKRAAEEKRKADAAAAAAKAAEEKRKADEAAAAAAAAEKAERERLRREKLNAPKDDTQQDVFETLAEQNPDAATPIPEGAATTKTKAEKLKELTDRARVEWSEMLDASEAEFDALPKAEQNEWMEEVETGRLNPAEMIDLGEHLRERAAQGKPRKVKASEEAPASSSINTSDLTTFEGLANSITALMGITNVADYMVLRGKINNAYLAFSGDRDALLFGMPLRAYFTETLERPTGSNWDKDYTNIVQEAVGRASLNVELDSDTRRYRVYAIDPKTKDYVYADDAMKAMDAPKAGSKPARGRKKKGQPEGNFFRADTNAAVSPMGTGRITLLLKGIVGKLAYKPQTFVFENMEDMRAKNPELFRRAAASRKAKDFETTAAAAFTFGDTVILFSDYIHTEQQLSFIMAHETIGHFGFRALLNPADLKRAMRSIYNSDYRLARAVDKLAEVRGIKDKDEATEEYLADEAARLDNSLIMRVWNTIKNALNRLGIKFGDEAARLLISNARSAVRFGEGTSFFTARTIADRMKALATDEFEGRFSVAALDRETIATAAAKARGMNYRGSLSDSGVTGRLRSSKSKVSQLMGAALTALQTLDYQASKNDGLAAVFRLFSDQANDVKRLLNKYNSLTPFTHAANWYGFTSAPTDEDRMLASQALANIRLARMHIVDKLDFTKYANLINDDGSFNTTLYNSLVAEAAISRADVEKGVEWYDPVRKEMRKLEPVKLTDNAWKIVNENTEAINQAAIDHLMAHYDAFAHSTGHMMSVISAMSDATGTKKFSVDDLIAIRQISEKYRALYFKDSTVDKRGGLKLNKENTTLADTFLIEATRAFRTDEKVKDWLNGNPKEKTDTLFAGDEYKDVREAFKKLSNFKVDEDGLYDIQRVLRNTSASEVDMRNRQAYAIKTILGRYVPFKRDGKFEIRLVAYKAGTDEVVTLSSDFDSSRYYGREDTEADAGARAEELDRIYNSDATGKRSLNTYQVTDADGNVVPVNFKVEYNTARQTPDLGSVMDYTDLIYLLDRTGIGLQPQERQRLVEALSAQGAAARARLQLDANPGWRVEMIRNISEHLEQLAHRAAADKYRHRLSDIMINNGLWMGDKTKLNSKRLAWEQAKASGNPVKAARLLREYEQYAAMYAESRAKTAGEPDFIEVNGKKLELRGKGRAFQEEAKKLLRWHSENTNITDSAEDWLNTGIGAQLKTFTVMSHLGMSVATAVANVMSLSTHTLTYMAYHNPKNGFGMGIGVANAAKIIAKASRNMLSFKLEDVETWENMIKNNTYGQYGLTKREAMFMLDEMQSGRMAPALSDALLSTSRGRPPGSKTASFVRGWMTTFNYTEALNRRTTVLATYRAEFARLKAEGMSDIEADAAARKAADVALTTTQGEYSMFNRPETFRGPILQYVFMYKMFTILTVQMLRKLPMSGKLHFLAFMFILAGLKGLPFADDLMDLIDTICQLFGIPMMSVERTAYQIVDSMVPGAAPYFMRGSIDQILGGTFSTKVGMGDLVPLTGSLRYGAEPWREFSDFAGPVFGVAGDALAWLGLATRYGAETVGLAPDTTDWKRLLRENPVSFVRAIGDVAAYTEAGAVLNTKGQVIDKDFGIGTAVMRLLNFYPAEATRQHDAIRTLKYGVEYAKAVKSKFISAYREAAVARDREAMRAILQEVKDWNESAKGTGLEIKNFRDAAERSAKEAQRPAGERYLRTIPKDMRRDAEGVMTLFGFD